MNSGNRGIIISGGNVSLGTVAAGDHASATSTVNNEPASLDQLRQEIERLRAACHEARGSLSPDAERAAQELSSEARKASPDRSTLQSLLGRLGEGAKTVQSLTTVIASVKELVAAFVPM
jgi:hypothetical protein